MVQFCKLGKEQGMYPTGQLLAVLGNTPMFRYQYEQVKGFINSIRQQYNVFHPLTKFELFLGGSLW